MKKIVLTIILASFIFLIGILTVVSQTVVFSEDFESIVPPALPVGWTQEKTSGAVLINWETLSGGHAGNPSSAYN